MTEHQGQTNGYRTENGTLAAHILERGITASSDPAQMSGAMANGTCQVPRSWKDDGKTTIDHGRNHWAKDQAGAPAILNLPTDRSRIPQQSVSKDRLLIRLDAPLTLSLRRLALQHGVDLGTTLMAGWVAVLARLSSQDDFVISLHSDAHHGHVGQLADKALPLRINLSGEPSTPQLLERLQNSALAPMAHQDISLSQVAFQWRSREGHVGLTQVPKSVAANYDLELLLEEHGDQVVGELVFASALFDFATIKKHSGYLNAMLMSMVEDPRRPVATIDILSPEERTLILQTWNETSEKYPKYLCFHQMFEIQAEKTPRATAIVHGNQVLSYGELNSHANRLAHHLIELGVGLESRVAICVTQSPGMIVGTLAIMKAGATFVPLDPDFSGEGLHDILRDASPAVVLADTIGQVALGELILPTVDPNKLLSHPTSNPFVSGLTSCHQAYILYTSEPAGGFKGVMIEHRGVVNLAQAHTNLYDIQPSSRVLQYAPGGYDTSVWELLPLTNGASLYIPPAAVRQDIKELWNYVTKHSITLAALPSSVFQDGKALPECAIPPILALRGDTISQSLLENLASRGCTVFTSYGPTEATLGAVSWCCPPDFNGGVVPIGKPIANTQIYILNKNQQPVPLGATGELYIGGAGIARGYYKKPQLTAERFIQNPFSNDRRSRMFKTGDLARYLPDGNIMFLGRNIEHPSTQSKVESILQITPLTGKLTPEMLPLINLTQDDIDHIVEQTPGGVSNIQDIYPLLPLQDSILLHRLLATKGDSYLLSSQMAFENRALLDRYLQASQKVVDRHDILRTAFIWKGISTPVQVVWRHAAMPVQELTLNSANGPVVKQLEERFHPDNYHINLTRAPLIQYAIAQEADGRWLLFQLMHQLIGDRVALKIANQEIEAILHGRQHTLPAPQPARNLVAQSSQGATHDDHERFFKEMLHDIEEPSFPFGVSNVHSDGADITKSHQVLPQDLIDRLRLQAKQMGVSLVSLCHVAWAQVVARTSGQDHVVFGTALSGGQEWNTMGSINTLPFRCDTDVQVRECIHKTNAQLSALNEHRDASLLLAQSCSSVPSGTPLFSAFLNHLVTSLPSSDSIQGELIHYPGIELLGVKGLAEYPLTVTVEESGSATRLTVQAAQPIDSSRVGGYMRQALESLTKALEGATDVHVSDLEVVPAQERQLLLRTWNETQQEYPEDLCIHHLFEKHVERAPQATAVVYMDQSLTYDELNTRANCLAHHLIRLGVQPDDLVAICVDRSLEMIVGVLAILKAGGAYVPLDPTYASERLRDILTDAAPRIVIVDESGRMALGDAALSSTVVVDPSTGHDTEKQRDDHVNPQISDLTSSHIAYIIYTSGSTGKPKGVMVEHQGVVNLARSRIDVFGVTSSSRIAQFFAFGFDGCASDIFMAACLGGSLHVLPNCIRADPSQLWSYLETHSITQVILPPAILHGCKDLPPLSTNLTLSTAGEALAPGLLRTLQTLVPNGRIVNDYGPTEATVSAIAWKCPSQLFEGDVIPIGRPITNKRVYILNKHRQPVPTGVAGELYIGGVGVARGYLNRPDLTAQVFLSDPFVEEPGARMYKTGDMVRYLSDGNMVFLGRNDHQVKVRGFRIELGEIESRLSEHALVEETIVIATGEGSSKRLVAYVVANHDDSLVHTLRSYLSSCLPDYMVPAAIVRLDALPLTSNGKVDRKALPDPDSKAFARHDYEEPQGSIEIAIAQIWAELLNIDRVSRNDNFFALGGHSLLVVQLVERLRRIGLSVSISVLFKNPTLHVLAQSVHRHLDTSVPDNLIKLDAATVTPDMLPLVSLTQGDVDRVVSSVPGGVSNIKDIYALSPLQEGILFHHLLETQGDPYLLVFYVTFESRQLLDRYLEAVQKVVDRHDILRTALAWDNMATPAQVVWRQAPLHVSEVQLDTTDGPIKDQMMGRFDSRHTRIDLTQAPLMRHAVSKDTDGRWALVELIHHSIVDHTTVDLMRLEVAAIMEGRENTLTSPQPFRNFIAQVQSGESQANHKQFFTEMLSEIDTPSLPFGLADVRGHGDNVSSSHRLLSQDLNQQLRNHAKALDVSVASLCHLAWAMVLSRTSGEDRAVFGTVLFGRMQAGSGSDNAMGLFINTLPVRVDVQGAARETVLKTHDRLASLLDHEHASLVAAQRCSGVAQGTPLFGSILNYVYESTSRENSSIYPGIVHVEFKERTNYPITLSVEDYGASFGITADVVSPLDPSRISGYMEQALQSLVEAIELTTDIDVCGLGVLPVEEKELLMTTWNATDKEYPEDICIHHLFEKQAERTPEATALVFMDQSLTYGQLNERSNRLAHHLIGLGVRPDTFVAICVDRSIAMIVGVLAVLKAGGAYVPLDPSYPTDRLVGILEDCHPSIVLADAVGRATFSEVNSFSENHKNVDVKFIDPNDTFSSSGSNPVVPGLTSLHMSYIIYTSGSTGRPKGVMIEHQGVVNHTLSRFEGYDHTSRSELQFSSLNFDFSVLEIFTALSSGASLHLLHDDLRRDVDRLWRYIQDNSITQASLTPALFQDCKNLSPLTLPLRLTFAGDTLPPSLLRTMAPLLPEGTVVTNEYGPTETTVVAIRWESSTGCDTETVPIGRPITNKKVYILDRHRQPVPLGASGEIYIGGVGMARGYLNRPELTAELFLADPFSDVPGAKMYKTGDLGRYLSDGSIMFLGRNDHQIKIRGFRIEIGEIEARLSEHPLVENNIVIATGEGNSKRLVAYVTAHEDDNLIHTLRSYLSSCLPDYMVPAAIVRMDVLPINSNGKVDRKALPEPDISAFARRDFEEPKGETEIAIAPIWADLLNVDRVSRNDNFFALGGHSLLAVRLMNRLTSIGVQLPVSVLFASPTLSLFAETVRSHLGYTTDLPSEIVPVSRDGDIPLSFAQQRLWFLAQLEGFSETYHMPMALRLRGNLNREAIQYALDSLFARHEALRTTFIAVNGQPQVQLLPSDSGIPITWKDLRGVPDAEAQLQKISATEVSAPFDLTRGPLIRATMIQLNKGEHVFLLTQHHIVSDGWSMSVMCNELSVIYGAYSRGGRDPLPPLDIQYPDYASWQKQHISGDVLDAQCSYWRTNMEDAPVLINLPTDRPRPSQQSTRGETLPIRLDSQLTSALQALCQKHEVTMFMTVLTAWSAVLSRTSGQDDIIIGTPTANRSHRQIESLIGFFVNTLALRIDLTGDVTARQLLKRVKECTIGAQAHQDLPFEQVVDIVQPLRSLSHTPLFQVLFAWQNNLEADLYLPGVQTDPYTVGYDIVKFDMELQLAESGSEIIGNMTYPTALFDRTTMERHIGYLEAVLRAITDDIDKTISKVEFTAPAERELVLRTWNATETEYQDHLCIHHLFEQQAKLTPKATAVVFKDQSLTYSQLNERSNRLAHHLIKLGVQPDERIAVCVGRTIIMPVAVLAVLKAGGAYVPIDPAYASDRLRDILADTAPNVVIADEAGRIALGERSLSSVTVVDPDTVSKGEHSTKRQHDHQVNPKIKGLTPKHLAFIIYTSGSTGKPKGVMIEHQGVINLLKSRTDIFGVTSSTRIAQFFSFGFDGCSLDIFMTTCLGGCLHILPECIRTDPEQLWNYLDDHAITQVSLPPAILQSCKDSHPLRTSVTLITAGEAISPLLLRTLQTLVPNGKIVNDYGPSETIVSAISWTCPENFEGDVIPVGRPITNKKIYILDNHRQPVPIGVIGELYIGGVGIARGYLNRPELTSEVFLSDPFSDEPGARMYKTGDLARYLSDGNVVFVGRNDHQVKIRGFRIELGEIESRLAEHALVDETIVIATGEGSSKRLVAYVVAEHDDNLVHTLRSYLSSCLPDYMVPTAIVRMDSLPLTSNGKVDRKALPEPNSSAFARRDFEEPKGETEIAIAQIWAEVLNLDRVSRNDDFFAIGGHSLLAVRLMNRLTSIGVQLPVSVLFASPTLSLFAETVRSHLGYTTDLPSEIVPVSRDGDIPLSFAQQRLWFLAQLEGVSETYHMPMALRLRGSLNREAIQYALDSLFARHEALRTAFIAVNGQPQVHLLPSDSGIPITWKDLRGVPDAEVRLQQMSAEEASAPFDLTQGPLIRATMIQLDKDEHIFLLTQHHIVSDGWSMGVMCNELSVVYGAYIRGDRDPIVPLDIQYPDYASWQRKFISGDRLESYSSYWRKTLEDAPVLINLPTDRPRPPQLSTKGDHLPIRLDSQLTAALKALCQESGVTMFMAALTAWSAVLSRMSGQEDIIIGTPTANRNHHQVESLIGFFVNTLALRIDLTGDVTARQLLKRVKECTIGAQAHQDLPFEQVVDIVQPLRSMSHTPLFQVMFIWQNNEEPAWDLPGLRVDEYEVGYEISKFDMELQLQESGSELVGNLTYSTALFDRTTMERQVGYLQAVLRAMTDDIDKMMSRVDLPAPAERDLLLKTWNTTDKEYPEDICIHHLFEKQAERTPEATALVFMDQSLTYGQLNERSNRLAHHLIGLGVRPDTFVAICVDRSIAMIVGVLAVLKAGGAYVPLDPSYPTDRLVGILEDCHPSIVLADAVGRATFSEVNSFSENHKNVDVKFIDPNDTFSSSGSNPVVPRLTSLHMSYIIYTSGSTGRPKGVMIEHQGVVNHTLSRFEGYDHTSRSELQFSSLNFDFSVLEIFTALSSGASLHLLHDDLRRDVDRLWRYIQDNSITQASLTPALFQDCKNLSPLTLPLRLTFAGDTLPPSLLRTMAPLLPEGTVVTNEYGPTETTVVAIRWESSTGCDTETVPIGRPITNKKVYILDRHRQPVPLGASGEIYIGGVGMARGYLNRPELTAELFLADPFSDVPGAKMYKTGDLGRYLSDGSIMFLGRNDHQIKIRGFRIEIGEIEARLSEHPLVENNIVIATGEGNSKRLVAYVTAHEDDNLIHALRSYLSSCLPDYMVPAAIVRMDVLPINSNGKVDRKALPEPDISAFARHDYQEPQGSLEIAIAQIWADLLNIDRVSRNDNFFALGGHSLLVVQLMERLRRIGFSIPIRTLFKNPTLHILAQSIDHHLETTVPDNLITPDATSITPDMLPLVGLTQAEIDHIVSGVQGGVSNIQDIYSLAPLQEGILFHHVLETQGDPYLLISCMIFESRHLLDSYLGAVQKVVDRHDILRTAIVWNNVTTPVQVVWRQAQLEITELQLDVTDRPIRDQLMSLLDPRRNRIDLHQAPLMRYTVSKDVDNRWILVERLHHSIVDHTALEMMNIEISAFMEGRGHTLAPPQPYRNFISQVRSRHSQADHEKFFTEMLSDIDTPSLPFGLTDVHGHGGNVSSSHRLLSQDLNDRVRSHAKALGVSVASLCHLAWAMVISRTSGEDRAVFGTVLFGRMRAGPGADNAMGLYINTLPIRVDVSGSVRESVLGAHDRLASVLDHEHASLNLAQRCSSVPHGTPLFNSILNYRHNNMATDVSSNTAGIEHMESMERTNYPISLSVEDFGEKLGVTANVVSALDPVSICGHMEQALQSLVDAIDQKTDIDVHDLGIVGAEEKELLLNTWNATHLDYPTHLCVHQLFEQHVERAPEATAVVFKDQSLTYSQLNQRANRLAHYLIRLGVQPDARVAICMDRSLNMIVGVLAILKAGGAYVPLDPTYASDRLRDILADSDPNIVIADETGQIALGDALLSSKAVIDPNIAPVMERQNDAKVNPQIKGLTTKHLAYIIYTSGSTGKPKGVMIEHQGVVNLVRSRIDAYGVTSSSRIAQFFSFGFDGSAMDILTAMGTGGSLYILSDVVRYDQNLLWKYLEDNSITQALLPPAVLQGSNEFPTLTTPLTLITGGEALPPALIRSLQPLIPNGRIVNDYGPTEATISSVSWKVPPNFEGDIVPIGRPVANKRLYVLDNHRQLVPVGVVGELYIGGHGVGRGYLNRPDLTAQVFLHDPFSDEPGARMYKTGDLVRYLPDGNILFHGRNDHQVKIRGFRIELGEIESRLSHHPLVDKTIVIATGEGNNKRLVAYVVASPDDNLVNTLRSYLSSCLPDYMVPAAIVRLDALPLTSNGKIDRKALPDPDSNAFARNNYEEPQGEIEIAIAEIWAELLNIDRVGRNDNFFALGGHSLLVVQLIERLRRIGLSVPIRTLFKNPTLHVLAQSVDRHLDTVIPDNLITPDATAITPDMLPLVNLTQAEVDRVVDGVPGGVSNIQDIYALSPLQEGILVHHMLETQGDPYLLVSCMIFETRLLLDRYLEAVQQVVNRHDILRTAIAWENMTTPAQVVWRQAPLHVSELWLDVDGPVKNQLMRRLDPRRNRINLHQAPMMRHTISKDADHRWVLVERLHHLVADHTTLELMNIEITAFMEGQGDTLAPPQPFRNYIAQVHLGHSEADHEQFFTEMLSDIDTPSLPFGQTNVHGHGGDVSSSHRLLPQDLNERLRNYAKALDVSVASLCHLAWAMVISRTSGEDRVVFGTVLFGRMRSGPGADSAMGLFINTLPIRVDVNGGVRESVLQTHDRLASLLDHEHASLSLAQRCSSVPQGTPLFNSVLNYRHNSTSMDGPSVYPGIELVDNKERTNYPISVSIEDFGTSLGITADVMDTINPERICGYMEQALRSLVEVADQKTDIDMRGLGVLDAKEKELLLNTWNETYLEYPTHLCVHQLFEQHVERAPEATAVVFEDQSLTYRELNQRANRLAHHLIRLGVQPDARVAICMDRSLNMIVGVLAIQKAGGAYVPLDPAYASDRLRDILADSDPNILIADEAGRMALGDVPLPSATVVDPSVVLREELDAERRNDAKVNPKIKDLTTGHLAYIIYTSGSTGKPKGVMVEHQGVVNLVRSRIDAYGVTSSSRIAQFFSFGFDGSAMDILTAMGIGGSLHILSDVVRYDQNLLWKYLEDNSITQALLPPAILQGSKDLPMLSAPLTLTIGGEALPPALIRSLQPLIPNGRIVNDYGPTEATISSVSWKVPPNFEGDVVSIGRPVANKRLYILDNNRQLVPVGAAGELYIGGHGVARGYLNRPELTAQVFLPDPFSDEPGARMYKTGDLVRYLPDGNILFLGRNDHQVKIRGFRIELGEIESCLAGHHLVDKAVVIAVEDALGKRLVAYIVADANDQLTRILHAHLSTKLPNYMVPSAIIRMDEFPLTSNGKLDRRQLPTPENDSLANQLYEAPQGEIESALRDIWVPLLGVGRVGRNDDFFMLGGHSLLAVKMTSQIQAVLGFKISLADVFQAPTISQLASRLLDSGNSLEGAFNVLLPIKPRGNRAPLFCVHPGIGLSWRYISVARHLHADQPVYGLQVRGFFDDDEPASSIDEMALDYIDQIRKIQPHGPYRLLGYSLGGIIAHTMAAHLEKQGEKVALVGIMDTRPFNHELVELVAKELAERNENDTIEFLAGKKNDTDDGVTDQEKSFWKKVPEMDSWTVHLLRKHSTPSFSGDVILFRATVKSSPTAPLVYASDWEPYVQGKIEVHEINCVHEEMTQPVPVAEIGRVLEQRLEIVHNSCVKEE